MEQEKQIDCEEKYRCASIEYCTKMNEYVNSLEAQLKEMTGHLNMNNPDHAKALLSITWGILSEVERKTKDIGRCYERKVYNLRNIVVRESEDGLE